MLGGSYPWLGVAWTACTSHGYGEACGSVLMATWSSDFCLSFLMTSPWRLGTTVGKMNLLPSGWATLMLSWGWSPFASQFAKVCFQCT